MVRSLSPILVLVTVVFAFLTGCAAPTLAQAPAVGADPIVWKTEAGTAAPELARFNELLADLAERVKPGLVHVRVRRAAAEDEDADDPHGAPRRASGSGFVIDDRGFIVTNEHVVEGADEIDVRLSDGRKFRGTLVGRDKRTDLALLRIDGATGLTALPLGDSNRVRVGEFVLALGNPLNLEQSVSFGIVSRKGSPLMAAAPGFDFIQTDAAINPGNSGGPLVNVAGQVIGVNSMVTRAAVSSRGIGFAIPANLVKLLAPQLASKGRIDWGWLGVGIADVTEDDLARLRLKETRGVLVRSVMPGEPADKGGVRVDDVILAVGDTRLEGPRDLQRVVSATPVGTTVRLRVLRDGQEQDLDVVVGLYREASATMRPVDRKPKPTERKPSEEKKAPDKKAPEK